MAHSSKNMTVDFERSYIRAGAFCGLADMLGGRSEHFDSLLEAAGLSSACLVEPDSYIGAQKFGMALQLVSSRMNRPSLGLDWAGWSKPYFPQLGPIMLASSHARTIREVIAFAERVLPGHTNAYHPRIIYQSGRTELAYRLEINARMLDRRQVTEHLLAVISLIFETLTGVTEGKHVLVRFRHARPADVTPHTAIFKSPLEFNADHNELVFASKLLDLPVLCSQRNIRNCALNLINDRIAHIPDFDGSMASRVAVAIRAMLGVNIVSLNMLAGFMDLGPKTLQRRLAEEGASYGEILEAIRRSEALRLLASTNLPVHLVGAKLDYSSAPAFNLAFKRWTGLSPRAYRQSMTADGFASEDDDLPSSSMPHLRWDLVRCGTS